MGFLSLIHPWLDTFLELLVVIILIAEYLFDRNQVMKQAHKIKQRTKKREYFDELTQGEGK
jgi:heme exporter protein D